MLRSLYNLSQESHSTDGEKLCVNRWSSAVGRILYGWEGNCCRRSGGSERTRWAGNLGQNWARIIPRARDIVPLSLLRLGGVAPSPVTRMGSGMW
jgi:hypothetical protein